MTFAGRDFARARLSLRAAAACIALALLGGCISISYTRSMTRAEEEEFSRRFADALRDSMRESKAVGLARTLLPANAPAGVPLGVETGTLRRVESVMKKSVDEATDAARRAVPVMRELLGGVGPLISGRPIGVNAPPPLRLVLVDTGYPVAKVDADKRLITLDIRVYRALVIAGIAQALREVEVDAELDELIEIQNLAAAGRLNVIDPAKKPKESPKRKPNAGGPEHLAANYVRAVEIVLSLPPEAYHASYQLANGVERNPREIAYDLQMPELLGESLQSSIRSAWLTVLLHELGHTAMGHSIPAGITCEQRKGLELEADAYSAALRAVARLDSPTAAFFQGNFVEAFQLAFGGVLPSAGISDFYDVAYRVSGFDVGASGPVPAGASCYPSAEDRSKIAVTLNTAIANKITQESDEAVQKCIADKVAANAASPNPSFNFSVDITKECVDR